MRKGRIVISVVVLIVLAALTTLVIFLWSPIVKLLSNFWEQIVDPNREILSFAVFATISLLWLSLKNWAIWIKALAFIFVISLAGKMAGIEIGEIFNQTKYQVVSIAFLVILLVIKFRHDNGVSGKAKNLLSEKEHFSGKVMLKAGSALSVVVVQAYNGEYSDQAINVGTVVRIPRFVRINKSRNSTTISFNSKQLDFGGNWAVKAIADGKISLYSFRSGTIVIPERATLNISHSTWEDAVVSIKF